jgi:hypothetical protein
LKEIRLENIERRVPVTSESKSESIPVTSGSETEEKVQYEPKFSIESESQISEEY